MIEIDQENLPSAKVTCTKDKRYGMSPYVTTNEQCKPSAFKTIKNRMVGSAFSDLGVEALTNFSTQSRMSQAQGEM